MQFTRVYSPSVDKLFTVWLVELTTIFKWAQHKYLHIGGEGRVWWQKIYTTAKYSFTKTLFKDQLNTHGCLTGHRKEP